MKRILVNFMTSNTGGVVNFKKQVLCHLSDIAADGNDEYYVLVDTHNTKAFSEKTRHLHFVENVEVPVSNTDKIKFYEQKIEAIAIDLKVDKLLNFGDIPARFSGKQVFYFDWPYAVYESTEVWLRMNPREFLSKLLKRFYFWRRISRCDLIVCQTETMKNRLLRRKPSLKLQVVDVGFDIDEQTVITSKEVMKTDAPILIYPTAIYPHKNLGVLIEVANRLKSLGFKLIFRLTFDESTGEKEAQFCANVKQQDIGDYFEFTGRLTRDELLKAIRSATGFIMPTLIETYGLPYLEAQLLGKPMFTSDRDFARELCGDSAFYFDPLDAESISQVLLDNIHKHELLEEKLTISNSMFEKKISWSESVKLINQLTLNV